MATPARSISARNSLSLGSGVRHGNSSLMRRMACAR